jgi:hypothetical protein
MSIFRRLLGPKVITNRRRIPGELVEIVLRQKLSGCLAPNYHHVGTKREVAVTTREMIQWASDKAYLKWIERTWECEQQAAEAVQQLHKFAIAEGCSHACGYLIGIDVLDRKPDEKQDSHVWVWGIVQDPDTSLRVVLYDTTNREWTDIPDVGNITFSLL